MPQINSGKNPSWVSGEIVTAAGLNGMIDAATLDPSAITSQTPLTTLTGDEYALVVDTAGLLKKTQLKNALLTGEDIKTDSITQVTGASAVLTIQSNAGVNTLIYSGGMLSLESGNGTQVNITSMGASLTGTINLEAGNGMTFDGNTGTIDFLSPVFFAGSIQGTANFTGTLQVNGSTAYVLTEIYENTIPTFIAVVAGQFNNIYTSPAFTKPSGEIWVIEIQATHSGKGGYVYEFAVRYGSQTPTTGSYIGYERFHDGNGGGAHCVKTYLNRWVFQSSDTFTNETICVDCNLGNGSEFQFAPTVWQYGGFVANIMATPSKFRIYKYKTA